MSATIKGAATELGTERIRKLLMQYAVPAIIAMTASSLYNMVDSIFIGHGVGPLAISGLALTFPLMNLAAAFGSLVGVGAATLVSMRLGQRDYGTAQNILGNVVVLNLIIGLAFGITTLLLLDPILYFFGASEATIGYARDYMSIILMGNVITHMYLGLNSVLRASGHPRKSMYATIYTVVINAALDPLFIFVFDMGIAGAALATALSQLVSFCILAWLFLHGRSIVRVHVRCISKRPGLYGEILLVGFPTICRQGFASLSSALLNNAAAVYSDAAVAAVTISNKVYLLVRSIVIGIGQGFQPVAGYNFGAGDKKRTRQAFWFSVLLGTAVCIVCAAVISLFPDEIMHFFRDDAEVTRIGRQALLYACAVMPLMGYSTYVNQLYQCLGFHQAATLLASCRNGLLYVPLILILPRMLGLPGVEMSQPGADLLTFVVSLPFQIWFFRHKLR